MRRSVERLEMEMEVTKEEFFKERGSDGGETDKVVKGGSRGKSEGKGEGNQEDFTKGGKGRKKEVKGAKRIFKRKVKGRKR